MWCDWQEEEGGRELAVLLGGLNLSQYHEPLRATTSYRALLGAARVGEGEEGPEEAEERLRAMLKASGVKKIGHREALLRAFRELPQAD